MGRPCRGGNQVVIDTSFIHSHRDIRAARGCDFGSDRGIATATTSLQHSGSRQQLRAVAEGRDWLTGLCEMADDIQNLGIQAQIFWSTTSGNDERVVALRPNFIERGI